MTRRRKQLSKREKREIVRQVFEEGRGKSRVAKAMGRSRGTISYFVKKWEETETIARRTVLTKEQKKSITRLVRKKPSLSLHKMQKRLGLEVSLPTIMRYLIKKGYSCENTRADWVREGS